MAKRTARRRERISDDTYNARRRFARAAQRNLTKARESSGATAEKYRQLARQSFENALSLYESGRSQRPSKLLTNIASELGIDIASAREEARESNRLDLLERSINTLESRLADSETRREQEARALLNDDRIGSRILGGLVDVWRDAATVIDETGKASIDNTRILPALFDYFKVNNLADMLEKLEASIGSKLYEMTGDAENIYEHVKIVIQTKVLENTLVQ